ncbi:MAG: zinc ABC transporter substrate-binding protein [Rickettsiales bacterium]
MRFIFIFILITIPTILLADNKKIITSIRPLQSIIANITDGSKDIGLIIEQNESLHNYHLTPDKILEINSSDIIIMIDDEFEIFMNKVLGRLDSNHFVIKVAKLPKVKLLKNQEHDHEHSHEDEDEHDHSHEHEHDHQHCHHLSEYDYHLWLDVDVVKNIAEQVTKILSKKIPQDAELYKQNLEIFIEKLNELDQNIKAKTASLANKKFIVTHNAYDYYINRYGFQTPLPLTIDHNSNIGALDLLNLQNSIASNKIDCIFEEPQFDSNIISKLKQNSKVKISKLDAEWGPEGTSVKDSYFAMMNTLTNSFYNCLAN